MADFYTPPPKQWAPKPKALNMIHKATLQNMAWRGMYGGAGGGNERIGGGSGRGAASPQENLQDFRDPVVSGMDYERNPTLGHGIISSHIGGGLTETGEAQQALHQRYSQMSQLYNQSLDQGATPSQALTAVYRADPSFLTDVLVNHPAALKAFQTVESLHAFMAGKGAESFGNITSAGQQPVVDPQTGEVLRMQDVPGFKAAPSTKAPRLLQTDKGYVSVTQGPDGQMIATPVQGPQGETIMPKATGKAPPGTAPGADGLPPQLLMTNQPRGTAEDRLSFQTLGATAPVIHALQGIYNAASGFGPGAGPVRLGAGEYLGINGQGASIKAYMDILRANAGKMQGSQYKSSIDSFMQGIATANNAPSFVRTQVPQMIDAIRQESQATADTLSQTRGAPLPPTLANPLINAGIVPNGYQTEGTKQQMGAENWARWKLQFYPQNITDNDYSALAQAAKRGDFGPPVAQGVPNSQMSPDLERVKGLWQRSKQQSQQQQQQGTASAAARSVNTPPSQPGVPAQAQQPADTGQIDLGQPDQQPQGSAQQAPQAPQTPQAPNDRDTQTTQPSAAPAAPQAPPQPQPPPGAMAAPPVQRSGVDANGNPYATAPIPPLAAGMASQGGSPLVQGGGANIASPYSAQDTGSAISAGAFNEGAGGGGGAGQ